MKEITTKEDALELIGNLMDGFNISIEEIDYY